MVKEKEAMRTLALLEVRRGKRKVPGEGGEEFHKEARNRETSHVELSKTPGDTFWDALEQTNPVVYAAIEQFAKEHEQKKQSYRQPSPQSPSVEELLRKNWDSPPRGNVHSQLGPKAPPEMSYHDHRDTHHNSRYLPYGHQRYDISYPEEP
ncbi:OLC1v1012301C1 [Oldenlandia corymbosa var. corymbosa]|uniref:OLC1v1012301C1 n=1 Tax=Oldenlandia corymbosa var. corymbosa TaxID=529605 RepID=A0AAV1DVU7_OLDCO|nr:OLC1v1012301C1 [Oldenlandia corymbosa var. corymbosa]